jgi:hypothetical protein
MKVIRLPDCLRSKKDNRKWYIKIYANKTHYKLSIGNRLFSGEKFNVNSENFSFDKNRNNLFTYWLKNYDNPLVNLLFGDEEE